MKKEQFYGLRWFLAVCCWQIAKWLSRWIAYGVYLIFPLGKPFYDGVTGVIFSFLAVVGVGLLTPSYKFKASAVIYGLVVAGLTIAFFTALRHSSGQVGWYWFLGSLVSGGLGLLLISRISKKPPYDKEEYTGGPV